MPQGLWMPRYSQGSGAFPFGGASLHLGSPNPKPKTEPLFFAFPGSGSSFRGPTSRSSTTFCNSSSPAAIAAL